MMKLGAMMLSMMGMFISVAQAQDEKSVWDIEFQSIDGGVIRLADYQGKVLLIVNTASKCGFTPQYRSLQKLWDTYRYKGLVVIGVPSNDFANQEPEDEAAIKEFCELRYGVNFPLTKKEVVTGKKAHPFYQLMAQRLEGWGRPFWNFHKYLIAHDGRIAGWHTGITKPDDEKFVRDLEKLLDEAKEAKG